MMLGHSGYLQVCRRALNYSLRQAGVEFTNGDLDRLMEAWDRLRPFEDAVQGLSRLKGAFKLAAVSNGERRHLQKLVKNNIRVPFDAVVSAEDAGAFKPHPAVYRTATRHLGLEPQQIMMVSAHSFDILGARACGYRAAYVNRYGLPLEDTPYQPDLVATDFMELADSLLGV
jgi:2-haloacid dehalogenase